MARLLLKKGVELLGEFELRRRVTLGRKADNDILINDPAVSGHHAVIEMHQGHFRLHDLDSTNGTHLNGRKVQRTGLRNGDEIRLGSHSLHYSGPDAPPSFMDTMILELNARGAPSSERVQKALAAAGASPADAGNGRKARLEILTGPNAGEVVPLEGPLTTVGLSGKQVAAVSRRRDAFFVVPIDGGPPTVNGKDSGPRSIRLKDRDEIEIAGVRMAFRCQQGDAGEL
jgi:predicted component of type VI protein secretion system